MTISNMTRDVSGAVAYGLPFCANAYSATLAVTTDTTLTVPSISPMGNATLNGTALPNLMAVFTFDPGTSVWVANGATAGVPAGASFGATASELNPAVRFVKGGDVLHFYTSGTGVNVSVLFYSLD